MRDSISVAVWYRNDAAATVDSCSSAVLFSPLRSTVSIRARALQVANARIAELEGVELTTA